jgi:histidine triad (HIT) family protein
VGRLDVDPIGSKYPIAAEGFFPPEATPKDTIGDLMASACIFCAIVAGSEPSRQVMESERTLAFLDINPAADGHTLVAPKAHATDIWTLTEDVASDVWRLTVAVARRLNDVLHPDGMTLFQANGKAGWQDVFHFHLHVVPRWGGDSLVRPWRPTPGDPEHLDEVAARLQHPQAG